MFITSRVWQIMSYPFSCYSLGRVNDNGTVRNSNHNVIVYARGVSMKYAAINLLQLVLAQMTSFYLMEGYKIRKMRAKLQIN